MHLPARSNLPAGTKHLCTEPDLLAGNYPLRRSAGLIRSVIVTSLQMTIALTPITCALSLSYHERNMYCRNRAVWQNKRSMNYHRAMNWQRVAMTTVSKISRGDGPLDPLVVVLFKAAPGEVPVWFWSKAVTNGLPT